MPNFSRLTRGHGSGAEYAMEAENYFNQGDFENAEISAQKALLKAQAGMDESVIFSAQYFQILIAFMKGNLTRVMELMDKCTRYGLTPCHWRIYTLKHLPLL